MSFAIRPDHSLGPDSIQMNGLGTKLVSRKPGGLTNSLVAANAEALLPKNFKIGKEEEDQVDPLQPETQRSQPKLDARPLMLHDPLLADLGYAGTL